MKLSRLIPLAGSVCIAAAMLTGCAQPKRVVPWAFTDDSVRSILVVPVVSESNVVGSDMLLYSATSYPLAEGGYYPFPLETVKMVLEQEGLYEPERVHQLDSAKLAELFGADSVLKITIHEWDAKYAVTNTSIVVRATYALDKKDGTRLWQDTVQFIWRSDGGQAPNSLAGLIAQAVVAAINRANPDFRPAANAVNWHAIRFWRLGPIIREEIQKRAGQSNNAQ